MQEGDLRNSPKQARNREPEFGGLQPGVPPPKRYVSGAIMRAAGNGGEQRLIIRVYGIARDARAYCPSGLFEKSRIIAHG